MPALKMPKETRNYLPKLQAVKNIIAIVSACFRVDRLSTCPHPVFAKVPGDIDATKVTVAEDGRRGIAHRILVDKWW